MLADKSSCLATEAVTFVVFDTRLLYAGHPSQPSAPPAPLQLPPPGHEPDVCSGVRYGKDEIGFVLFVFADTEWLRFRLGVSVATTELGLLKWVGRGALRDFRYKPHALQMVVPVGDLLHSGVFVVPQLLCDTLVNHH